MIDLKERIALLPAPTILQETAIEKIIEENVALTKDLMEQKGINWEPCESDPNMMQIEAFSYKELALRKRINKLIRAMLPHLSSGDDLDNFIFAFYAGEQRHLGEEPTAPYRFSIEEPLGVNITVPKGFTLSDGDINTSYLKEDLVIQAGSLSADGKVELNEKTQKSEAQTTNVISPYPYVLKVEALGPFEGGSNKETDEEFFARAILSLYKYSTAGGQKAYEYFAYLADERVKDVKVISLEPVKVDVIINADEAIAETVAAVDEKLNGDEKTQCFCDVVTVRAATKKVVTLEPTIYLIDMLAQASTLQELKNSLTNEFKIGVGLPYSKIIKALEIQNVYKVELEPNDLVVASDEVLSISLNPTFVKAEF